MIIKKNHSIISGDIIDLNKFKLLRNSKFIEIILRKNDYLYIPPGWSHWIFTKEKTLAFSYELLIENINSMKYNENKLINNIIKNTPFYGNYNNFDYTYENFMSNNLENDFIFELNELNDISPVRKPFKTKKTDILFYRLKSVFQNNLNINNDKFLYSPGNVIYSSKDCKEYINFENQTELKEIPNFCNFKNNCNFNFDYKKSVWFSFNDYLSSGIHFDLMQNILFVVEGEKKVLLSPPNYTMFLYNTTLVQL